MLAWSNDIKDILGLFNVLLVVHGDILFIWLTSGVVLYRGKLIIITELIWGHILVCILLLLELLDISSLLLLVVRVESSLIAIAEA